MAITLNLRVAAEQLVVDFDDQRDSVRIPVESLPAIERLQADPFTHGKVLTNALGGETYLLKRLQIDPDNLILLDCDDKADSFAWEFATCSDGQFICIKAGMLRTVERDAPSITGDGAINFVALMADPLVDEQGNPREGYRLDLDNEMKAIRATLQNCGKSLEARRIPPIREELYKALRKGPAILHLSCHGNVVPTENGPMAVLSLEKKDGSQDSFAGSDLMNTKRGILRLVLLSACRTATGTQANLARALALNGIPMTVGMQESIDDTLSDEIATALYDSLFSGFTFGEALQQARQNISQRFESVGLLVGYIARNGWKETLPLRDGTAMVGSLGKPGIASLGGEIQPPRPLLGRNLELYQLAKLFAEGQKVMTVAGTGGMGKTALAAAFAERFAWIWSQGVRAYSFANEVNFASFIAALLRTLYGNDAAIQAAALPDNEKRQAVLDGASQWDGLWLFDNYESIMQGLLEDNNEAERIHRLIGDLANGGTMLLLTSREQPAGLKNERLFPEGRHLVGLRDEAGVELFFQHSVKAKEDSEADGEFALQIQHAAEGHPLAIALLAGEYDTSAVSQEDFLKNWQDELASARREGLAGHHVTFTTAFERSYSHLSPDLKLALTALSIFPFPFFARGFAVVTGELPKDDESLATARQILNELTRRSLLEVDGTFEDGIPATYRFQPALRQETARRVDENQKENQSKGYASYGAWLAERGYGGVQSDLALNRLVRLSMDAMEKAMDSLQETDRLWHIKYLTWLKIMWGETRAAFGILTSTISSTLPDPTTDPDRARVESSLRFELADLYTKQGNLDRALDLFKETTQLYEQLGDEANRITSLHQMAKIYLGLDDLDRALNLCEEVLRVDKELDNKEGHAASLIVMAIIFRRRGDLDHALALYQESLQLSEQLGDKRAKASTLSSMSLVYWEKQDYDQAQRLLETAIALSLQVGDLEEVAYDRTKLGQLSEMRGDKETALAHYRDSLALFEKLDVQPLITQVKQLIAGLENDTSLQAITQARSAAERGDTESAIQYQEQAVELARGAGEEREALVTLSVRLYNLASYYQNAERHDDAVKAMEEVVAIDEQIGHEDLEADRERLEAIRHIASMSPEERAALREQNKETEADDAENEDFESYLQDQLAKLPPEQRAEAEAQIRQAFEEFQRMSPEEQAIAFQEAQAARDANNRAQIDKAANQARDAALAYFRKRAPKKDILNYINDLAQKAAEGEEAGSPWLDVAALCNSLVALIKEEPIPPLPAKYVAHFSAVQQEMKS
jgi:tetratricopeptide (TPR) repeat protein